MADDINEKPVLLTRLIIAAVLALTTYAAKAERNVLPKDVSVFIQRRDICDHFRGEPFDGDPERREFVAQQLNKFCDGTDKSLAHLRKKYSNEPSIIRRLNRYDSCIEASSACH